MNKYTIYRLTCAATNRYYIGSTNQPLKNRLVGHKSIYNPCRSRGFINPTIIPLEVIETDDVIEVLEKEKEIIKLCKSTGDLIVNRNMPNRKFREYYQDNKDKITEYKKDYYTDNKEYIKNRQKCYYYRNHDIDKIKNKEIKEIMIEKQNKNLNDKKNQYLKEQVFCDDCACLITRRHIARHFKSDKHIANSSS